MVTPHDDRWLAIFRHVESGLPGDEAQQLMAAAVDDPHFFVVEVLSAHGCGRIRLDVESVRILARYTSQMVAVAS